MEIQEAITAFAQSEKIKSGIIWVSQVLELANGLPDKEKQGGEKVIKTLIDMIVNEIRLSQNVTNDSSWEEIEKVIDQAVIMIDSGVAHESIPHLTRALSLVVGICHSSMSFLKEKKLL